MQARRFRPQGNIQERRYSGIPSDLREGAKKQVKKRKATLNMRIFKEESSNEKVLIGGKNELPTT